MLVRFGLAALSGLLTFAAFPGVGAWPLAFVAWVPLLLALEGVSLRRAAALGFVAGLAATLPAFRFLYPTLRAESGFGPLACALVVLAVAAYHALRGLLIGLFARAPLFRARARDGAAPTFLARTTLFRALPANDPDSGPPALLFIAGLVASEIAVPSLFPWFFGATVHNLPLLTQTAELGGPVAVSVVLALSSVAVAETVSALRADRRTRPRVIVTALAVPIIAAFWGSLRLGEIDARARAAPAFTVGVVQPNLTRGSEIEAVRVHREATTDLVARGATLVVWAEGAVPWTLPAPFAADAFTMFHLPPVPVLAGAIVQGHDPPSPDPKGATRIANSALLVDPGHPLGRYDKHRLLPFSESLPLADTFPILRDWSPRSGNFVPGTTLAPLPFRDHRIATFICYEDLLPGHVRALVRSRDVDLLVNLTNDSWFLGTDEPEMHLALARLRAVEHRKYLVRATLTGTSAIVDPVGRLLVTLPQNQQGTLLADIHWMRGATLYGRLGDAPWWLLVAASLGLALSRRRSSSTAA